MRVGRRGSDEAPRPRRSRTGFGRCVAWLLGVVVGPVLLLGVTGWFYVRSHSGELASLAVVPRQLEIVAVVAATAMVVWLFVLLTTYLTTRPRRPTRRQEILGPLLTMALGVIVVVPLATTSYYAMVTRDTINTVASNPASATVPKIAATKQNPWGDKRRVNLMLLGGDGGVGRTGVRTDTVIVASMDTRTGKTVLFSLPRNLRDTPFPEGTELHDLYPNGFDTGGSPGESMLNAIYRNVPALHPDAIEGSDNEGADAVKLAASGALGIDVDYYLLVNLKGFREIVNAIGGITVNVNERVAINGNVSAGIPPTGYIEPGPDKRLNGFNALWFTRGRWGSTDYKRMERQRCAINAIVDEADPANLLLRYTRLAGVGKKILRTDIPQSVLPAFVDTALKMKGQKLTSVVFQRDATFDPNNPDFEVVQTSVRRAIAASERGPRRPAPPALRALRAATKVGTGRLKTLEEVREAEEQAEQENEQEEQDSVEATTADDVCAYHPESDDDSETSDDTGAVAGRTND